MSARTPTTTPPLPTSSPTTSAATLEVSAPGHPPRLQLLTPATLSAWLLTRKPTTQAQPASTYQRPQAAPPATTAPDLGSRSPRLALKSPLDPSRSRTSPPTASRSQAAPVSVPSNISHVNHISDSNSPWRILAPCRAHRSPRC